MNAPTPATPQAITLPDRNTDAGAEARILLAECPGPGYASYAPEAAREAMQLMDAVLWNRLRNPAPFGARGATHIAGIIKARGQFQGFGSYPAYSAAIRRNLEAELAIANNPHDRRHAAYADFVQTAIAIAQSTDYRDPSPGTLVAWRTSGSGSPGRQFLFYRTVLGNDFYYEPAPLPATVISPHQAVRQPEHTPPSHVGGRAGR